MSARAPGPAVLIVTAARTERELLAIAVSHLGCRPVVVEETESCLAELQRESPAAVLLDFALASHCRPIKSACGAPLLVLTEPGATRQALAAGCWGADDFLSLPAGVGQLEAKLRAVLSATSPKPPPSGPGPRLLLVTADRFLRHALAQPLEHRGFSVLGAEHPEAAAGLLEGRYPALDGCVIDVGPGDVAGVGRLASLLEGRPLVVLLPAGSAEAPEAVLAATLGSQALESRDIPLDLIAARIASRFLPTVRESRAGERVPLFSIVRFRENPWQQWLDGLSYNVSARGLFVRTVSPLAAGRTVELQLALGGQERCVTIDGRVVWTRPLHRREAFSSPRGMGITFLHLEPADATWIDAWVAQRPSPREAARWSGPT